MQDRYLLYDDNLAMCISGDLEYHKRFGLLSKKELWKKYAFFIVMAVSVTVSLVLLDIKNVFNLILIGMFAVWTVVMCVHTRRKMARSISKFTTVRYLAKISADSSIKLTFREKGIEALTPYSRIFIPYTDIECVISPKEYLYIKVRGTDLCYTVPKKGQNLESLMRCDSILRIELKERYISIKIGK